MSIEQRMAKAAEDDEKSGLHPLLKDRLHRPRSVFSPGHRIRMNILPMFLNIFLPWGVFIFCLGITSFWVMYTKPSLAYALVGCCIFIWLVTVLIAINRRRNDPEPAWYTYFAVMTGIAVFGGFFLGMNIFKNFSLPYYMVKDLKVIGHLDVNQERGQNVMDSGIVYFADGNGLDPTRSWHFKHGTVYCVAPIVGAGGLPESGSFDFWAVGKDCCSQESFECGDVMIPEARSGELLTDSTGDYRLAVTMATVKYGVKTPIQLVFVTWTKKTMVPDPGR